MAFWTKHYNDLAGIIIIFLKIYQPIQKSHHIADLY